MSVATVRMMLAAFLLLSVGVAVNLLTMQPSRNNAPALKLYTEHQVAKPVAETARRPAMPALEPAPAVIAAKRQAAVAETRPAVSEPVEQPRSAAPQARAAAAPETANREVSFRDVTAAVQARLAARGYEAGQPDGVIGLVTRAAILAFEHDHGLAATAEPSEALLRALEVGPSAISSAVYAATARDKRGRAEQVVKTVQQSLITLGYAIAKPNGRVGEDTERSIREFEMDQRMPVTGRISGSLVSRLARIAGHGKLTAGR